MQALIIGLFGNEDNGKILDINKKIEFLIEHKYFNHFHINKKTIKVIKIREEYSALDVFSQIGKNEDIEKELKKESDFFVKFEEFATYGASRLNKSKDETSKTYSLFNSDGTLLDIEGKLIEWEGNKIQNLFYEGAKSILIDLLNPQVENIKVERKGSKNTVLYKETESEKDNDWKTFNELASGYRSIVAMVGDMIIRLSETQPEITDFNKLVGIVIIDEFDLHLHPKWQKELVEKLTKTFPKIQFIVSTHSPIPLLGAPANSIILKVDRNKKDGITAKKLDIDISELSPENLLSSPIFDFQDIFPASNKTGRLRTEKGYDEVVFNKILEQKLQNIANEAGVEYKKPKKL